MAIEDFKYEFKTSGTSEGLKEAFRTTGRQVTYGGLGQNGNHNDVAAFFYTDAKGEWFRCLLVEDVVKELLEEFRGHGGRKRADKLLQRVVDDFAALRNG